MFSGFNADYEASSSRCSSASPAGDNLSYYHSPADSFSSMGSPVNAQVSLASRRRGARGPGVPGEETAGRDAREDESRTPSTGVGGCPGRSSLVSGAPDLFGAHAPLS